MITRRTLSAILAGLGTLAAWLPILVTLVITVLGSLRAGALRFDFLLPAELFPAAVVGGALLLGAALLAHARRNLIGWSVGLMLVALVGGQALAVISGLASGAREPAGWPWRLVIASLGVYAGALVAVAIGGLLLLRDLTAPRPRLP
jgi:hypothetical protein